LLGRTTIDEGFLNLIYESVLDTSLWADILTRLADGAGGEGSALVWQDLTTNAVKGVNTRLDPEAAELFSGYFATRNPLRPSTSDVLRMIPAWSPRLILDEDRLPKGEFMRTEFYNDFFRRFGFHSSVAIGLAVEGRDGGTIDIVRGPRKGRFEEDELRFCSEVQPHLVRVFRLGRKLAAERAMNDGAGERFERSALGIFILSVDGRVRHMNPSAADLTTRSVGLRVVKGRLAAVEAQADRRLQALIGLAGANDAQSRAGGSMGAPAAERGLPLSVTVVPMRTERFSVFEEPSVMVCVTDLERGLSVPAETMRELFGLTAAESRLALALFDGGDIPQVAANLGIRANTARVQLTRIFEKTGTNRQGTLMKLMARCVQDSLG